LALEQSLHHALERRELELHYQPVYDRMRRRPVSVEALIRWNHPTRGLVPPADFIPLAEETGLIVPIGEWVVREVCGQLRRWHDAGLTALKAAINISAPQLQQPTFTRVVVDTLQRNGLEPSSLQIEITETVAVQNIDLILQVLQELKQHGVGIAIVAAAQKSDDEFLDNLYKARSFSHVEISPDGKRVAWIVEDHGLTVANVDGTNRKHIDDATATAFAPDGTLAYLAGKTQKQLFVGDKKLTD